jgi:hypothetical protein
MDSYDGTERLEFRLGDAPDQAEVELLRGSLETANGARLLGVHGATVLVEYHPMITSRAMVADAIEAVGLKRRKAPPKGRLSRRLERMGKRSRELFGDGKPNCCDLPK